MTAKVMHMVAEATYGPDGLTVVYGAGELHAPGSLPDGVPYREVLASEDFAASAPGTFSITHGIPQPASRSRVAASIHPVPCSAEFQVGDRMWS